VQYADYAVWQRQQLRDDVLDGQLAYWRERLAGAPALLELPADRPRPAVQRHHGAYEPFRLPDSLAGRLQALGRSEGATLYMTLLGAFQVLLAKYSGSEDVVVGSPIAGRTRMEVEELIGFFVNTLVLRTDLSGDPGFRDVLRRVREVTLGAYEHQEVPFERLVEELAPERSLGHSPLFQVMFSLVEAPHDEGGLAGLRAEALEAEAATTKFDLSLSFAVHSAGLAGGLEYDTDLFERGTVVRMLGHLERVLEQVAADADVRLSELELLGAGERRLVVEEWNRTEAEFPADRCIHQLFEAQAERTPDSPAVVFEDASLTYRELNRRANRLAHHLIGRGVGPESRVGLFLERSLELVVSLLAVLKAGGAYVPLDPASPPERLERMLAGSATALVLTQERLRGLLPARAALEVIGVDGPEAHIAEGSAAGPESRATPRGLAYVLHTSGSTGTPKAVAVEHGALVNHMEWFVRDFGLGAADRVLQKTPITFDASVWEFHAPLLVGGCLVVARPDGERDPRYLARIVRERGITVLQLVPSLLRVLVEEPEFGACT
ncbi:MAG TPA: AMP-binding protein, partial [Longimicrobiaceae bacterium]|nr:AMP-binding protein [Longimicrobiaceae bacterium]